MAVKVLNPGLSTTVQDLGRPGYFHLGIPMGGAMDRLALRAANLIVGNDAQGKGGEKFEGYTYAVRPPGVYHGPFKSDGGCLLLETHYYDVTPK